MKAHRSLFLICFFFLILAHQSLGQRKITIRHTETLEGGRIDGEKFDKFIGNVIFSQNDSWIYCDTAIFFKKRNTIEASGNVKITRGDSLIITARKLIYEGNSRVAKLRKNVVFTRLGLMTLYTNYLDFDRDSQVATYYNNGNLVDSTNQLTSNRGYYNVNTDVASFKGDVVGVNEDWTLRSDTLQYNASTKIIYFRDSTWVVDKEGNEFTYADGIYDTNTEKSDLNQNLFETDEYILRADFLTLDEKREYYRAKGDVELVDKKNEIIVSGQSGEYWDKKQLAKVYDNALMRVISKSDTLYLSADTLISIDSKISADKRLLAFHNVRIYKNDLQGLCDSLVYVISDSTIFFYGNPILWNEGNQINADSINAIISDNSIDRMYLDVNSFVVSKDTMNNFNQIKGRRMIAYFKGNNIDKVDVFGNGESIFHAVDEEKNELTGVNKTVSATLTINFENQRAKNIIFYREAEASFIPPHELTDSVRKLKGFKWRENERPTREDVIPESFKLKISQDQSKPFVRSKVD